IDQRRSAQSAIQRRVLAAALPVVGGALAGAAVAVFAVLSLRPPPAPPVHPVVAAPVVTPAADAQQAPPPHVEAQTEAEIPNPPAAAPSPPRKRAPRKSPAAAEHAAAGDKALRAFNTAAAQTAFETALNEDPSLPAAHRGLGMVYVLQGRNDAAKAEYEKYLLLAP